MKRNTIHHHLLHENLIIFVNASQHEMILLEKNLGNFIKKLAEF